MIFTKTTILALTFFLAKGTEAASLRGKTDNGGLRHLQSSDLEMENADHFYRKDDTGGCKDDMNELGVTQESLRDCAALCEDEWACLSFQYPKDGGTRCALSNSCNGDRWKATVQDPDDSNYLYIRTHFSFNPDPCHPRTIGAGENFSLLVNICLAREPQPSLAPWDTSLVTNMASAFADQEDYNEDISDWDTSNVNNMHGMFARASSFNQPIGKWDTSKVTDMGSMFLEASKFNQPIDYWDGNWDTSKVEDMGYMFSKASVFNQPVGNWRLSKVTTMNHMFNDASAFNQCIEQWPGRLTELNWDGMGSPVNAIFDGSSCEVQSYPWPTLESLWCQQCP